MDYEYHVRFDVASVSDVEEISMKLIISLILYYSIILTLQTDTVY